MVAGGLHLLLPIAVLGAWALEIEGVRLRDMTDLGLVSVTPPIALALILVLTVSFCLSLSRRPLGPWIPLVHVLVLIVILFGVTAFLEAEPRGAPVWRHVGIMDYIDRTGAVDPGIDAYFNWPGFFGLGAFITDAAGFASPLAIAAWGPLVFNLLVFAPLAVIFRWATDDPRARWLGLWIFYSANWVGQDYISPQALGFTLWLSMLAALLTWFTPRPAMLAAGPTLRTLLAAIDVRRLPARLGRTTETLERVGSPHRRAGLVVVVVALYAAVVTGHQLTPFVALLAVTPLVLFARLELRLLPVIMIVVLAGWLSYASTSYLVGHFEVVAGPLTSAGQNINKSVGARISGSSDHELVVHIRLLSSAAIWALALAGLARRIRARYADIALVLIAFSPFALPVIQPYGGEMVLRVFLFSLPPVAFFIASLAFPSIGAGRGWGTLAAVTVVCCALIASFEFTRYGNERLDHFTRGDVAAVSALYRVAPPGATLIGSQNLPWRNHDYVGYDYRTVSDFSAWKQSASPDPRKLAEQIEASVAKKGAYLIVTRSSEVYASMLLGKERALSGLVGVLRTSPAAVEVYRGRDGDVFYIGA